MKNVNLAVLTLVSVSALAPQTARAVNLLNNGSFEQPPSTVNQYSSIPGWTRTCGTSVEIQSFAGTGLNAFDGNQWWESDGVNNTCLTQTVATQFNKVYQLTFAHSARPGIVNNAVEVYWNGTLLISINANGVGNTNTAWQVGIFNVVATGATSTLEFRAAGPSDALGGYIDGVSLEELYCDTRPRCFGDANGDGIVNFADISAVLAAFNTVCP
ncbi:MAG: DUF642 domain-containing protein [Phycisphaerae bacterium]|nr:DUF642 domain-containing protein [Phycisphaerae bacterium]